MLLVFHRVAVSSVYFVIDKTGNQSVHHYVEQTRENGEKRAFKGVNE